MAGLSYAGVEFNVGDRLLLSSDDEELIELTIDSHYAPKGDDVEPLDEWGFTVLSESYFPDSVRVLKQGEHAINLSHLAPVSPEKVRDGDVIVCRCFDGKTIAQFVVDEEDINEWIDGGVSITSPVSGITFNFGGKKSDVLLGRRN